MNLVVTGGCKRERRLFASLGTRSSLLGSDSRMKAAPIHPKAASMKEND
jgi:hypothetical protein